jgi:hypothetical protein
MSHGFSESGKSPLGESRSGSISIDQFIALNDELAALVRVGLPMERGLRNLAADIPGSLGQSVTRRE